MRKPGQRGNECVGRRSETVVGNRLRREETGEVQALADNALGHARAHEMLEDRKRRQLAGHGQPADEAGQTLDQWGANPAWRTTVERDTRLHGTA